MRATATITFYVYGEDEQDCFTQAELVAKNLDKKHGSHAEVEKLHKTPFASMCFDNSNEIDIDRLTRFDALKTEDLPF